MGPKRFRWMRKKFAALYGRKTYVLLRTLVAAEGAETGGISADLLLLTCAPICPSQVSFWSDPAHTPRFYNVKAHGLEQRSWLDVVKDRLEGSRLPRRCRVGRRDTCAGSVEEWCKPRRLAFAGIELCRPKAGAMRSVEDSALRDRLSVDALKRRGRRGRAVQCDDCR